MLASEAKLVASAVHGDVLLVLGAKLVDGSLDVSESSLLTHLLGGNIGVHTSSVPVTLGNGLGVKGAVDLEVLADAHEDVTRHHELITGINSDAWSNLVLLLSRHDLSIGAGDGDSGVKAGFVVGLSDVTAKVVLGSDGAVVGSLGAGGHATLRPAKGGLLIKIEEGELLLKSEPGLLIVVALERLHGDRAGIGGEGLAAGGVGVAHNQDVIDSVGARAEGVPEDPLGFEDDFGIVTGGLISGGSVEVPLGERINAGSLGDGKSTGLGTSVTDRIDPDILGQEHILRVGEGRKTVDDSGVESGGTSLLRKDLSVEGGRSAGRNKGRPGGGKGRRGTDGDGESGDGELHG
mmetsp:Transcript_27632/g.56632  ORF Transcript_27632/g.56632 Transcript_27632/m.56632 type:complete len:349 (+) Transcript_27632:463-1509(+)